MELMCGGLKKLFKLSLDLHKHSINMYRANKKIIFENRRTESGYFYKEAAVTTKIYGFVKSCCLKKKKLRMTFL